MEIYNIKRGSKFAILLLMLGQILSVRGINPEDFFAPTIGRVVILPHASFSTSFDDNVFLTSDKSIREDFSKIDDFLNTFSPGIGLRYGENVFDRNYIDFDYSTSLRRYNKNNQLNSDDHSINFGINYQKEGKFTFNGTDSITLDNNLLRGRENAIFATSGIGQESIRGLLVKKLSLRDRYRFEYVVSPKTSLYLATSLDMIDYAEEPHYYSATISNDLLLGDITQLVPYSLFDVSDWRNTVGFGWQAFPKIKLYGSLFSGITSVDTNLKRMGMRPDSDFYGGHISADGDFSEKLTGRLLAGYQTRNFDSSSNGFRGKSHSLPIFEVQLEYNYTKKGQFIFQYRRAGNVSVQNPEWASDLDYFALSLNQKLGTTGKLNGLLTSTFRRESFQAQETFKYHYLSLDAGIGYRFNQWMQSRFTYGFDFFGSSSKGNVDYDVNRVMFSLSVGY